MDSFQEKLRILELLFCRVRGDGRLSLHLLSFFRGAFEPGVLDAVFVADESFSRDSSVTPEKFWCGDFDGSLLTTDGLGMLGLAGLLADDGLAKRGEHRRLLLLLLLLFLIGVLDEKLESEPLHRGSSNEYDRERAGAGMGTISWPRSR